jgi:pyruvate ferredoxin oxidoreductase delta subunit
MIKISVGASVNIPGSSAEYKTGGWRTLIPEVKVEKCTRCKQCVDFCPDGAISMGKEAAEFDFEYCKGCGICAKECKFGAIEMIEEVK